jgi:hypothetical protein
MEEYNETAAPKDQQEELDDLELSQNWYYGATLWATDWTTETVINQLRKKNINLSPRFQRRDAWDKNRKSRFIESLILGLPVPQIILAEDKRKRGSFIVIDGKQRLLSLRQFFSNNDDNEFGQLILSGLDDVKKLNGLTFDNLQDDDTLCEELNTFENQTIRTVVIRNWADEKYLHSVFLRINGNSVQLSPQELRQALHPGPFSDYVDDFSAESAELQKALKLKKPDFRMRDAELALRYFSYRKFADRYEGNLKKFLDETTDHFNKKWDSEESSVVKYSEQFEFSLATCRKVFGEKNYLRKWNGTKFEGRINRAVFDVMSYYFSDQRVAQRSLENKKDVVSSFKELCEQNSDFLTSIETTTKSKEANTKRFGIWAERLSYITGQKIKSPMDR